MEIYPLYSSSSGNLFLLTSENTNILIDVGVNYKKVLEGLDGLNKSITDIDAIFITHEHSDHIAGLKVLTKKNNIPLYTTSKTKEYLLSHLNNYNNIFGYEYDEDVTINNLINFKFIQTSHDAVMPSAFYITCKDKSLSFLTDLGFTSSEILSYIDKSNYIVLESNYDKTMLMYGDYPFKIKQRIDGKLGHLSNADACNVITSTLAKNMNKTFLLAHISENNNNITLLKDNLFSHLKEHNLPIDNIFLASKNVSFEGYKI